MKLLARIRRFRKSEDGATAIEYGLIAALIAVVIIVAVTTVLCVASLVWFLPYSFANCFS